MGGHTVHAPVMRSALHLGLVFAIVACSGKATVDDGSGGSSSTNTTATGTTATGTATASTTSAACASHDDCDGVCLFASGQCADACEGYCDKCAPGTICDSCATSSCPECKDCRPACVPIDTGQCDDDDPCPMAEVCVWDKQLCAPSCNNGVCADPNMVCHECATGSCCGCEDCVGVCTSAE